MSYDDTLVLLEEDNETEIFSPPFQPYSPTDSDLDKCSFHTSESNSKNNSANNSWKKQLKFKKLYRDRSQQEHTVNER